MAHADIAVHLHHPPKRIDLESSPAFGKGFCILKIPICSFTSRSLFSRATVVVLPLKKLSISVLIVAFDRIDEHSYGDQSHAIGAMRCI